MLCQIFILIRRTVKNIPEILYSTTSEARSSLGKEILSELKVTNSNITLEVQ